MRDASVLRLSLFVVLAQVGCGGAAATSTPESTTPVAQAEPSSEPAPQPAPQHAEAVLAGGHITLNHQVLFDTGSDHIREAESAAVLNDLVSLLRENPQIRRVRVEGHTDERGAAARNQELSQQRAAAVAQYLSTHGFENVTFEPTGFGSTQPVCSEDTDACHERNRRVEFTVLDPATP